MGIEFRSISPGFLNKSLKLRLHWLAQSGTRSAPSRSAKPRSHSERRDVKAVVVRQRSPLLTFHSEFPTPRP
jgi:hypothetical protein